MRNRIALWLILNLLKGDETMMANMFASQIVLERINKSTGRPYVFDDVPPRLKEQVADTLINVCGLPNLVPPQFGGTMGQEA